MQVAAQEDDFVARWLAAGPAILAANHAAFRQLLGRAEKAFRDGDDAYAAAWCEIAAFHAVCNPSGLFASRALEAPAARIARRALGSSAIPRGPAAATGRPRSVLHVATSVEAVGGHTRMIRRWIERDAEAARHSIALIRQRKAVPPDVSRAVLAAGGRIFRLGTRRAGLLDLARELRAVAAGVDLVVLHVAPQDVVPLLAFSGLAERPPIALLDHADHLFWTGVSIADAVIGLRRSGRDLATGARGVAPERSLALPIPVEADARRRSRAEAKRRLGFDPSAPLIVSVARRVKYRSVGGLGFVDAHLPALLARPRASLVVVGPGERPDWAAAREAAGGRILVLPETPDVADFYDAADIHADSFPFVSTTSLLEAGLRATPLVGRNPFPPGAEILGADMPGLEGTMVASGTVAALTDTLVRLIDDPEGRAALGEATRRGIVGTHCGEAWKASLAAVHTAIAALDPVSPGGTEEDRADPMRTGLPDALLPFVHGADLERDALVCAQLHLMPPARRAAHALDLALRRGPGFGGRLDLVKCWIPSRIVARFR